MATAPFTENTISSGGGNRTYDYYSPTGLASPAPLCVVLHGGAQSIERILERLQMAGSPAAGPVTPPYHVVAPQGSAIASLTGWNSGHSPGGQQLGTDDVTFIEEVVNDYSVQVSATASPVDPKRIYVIGFSNGGMMAYRLAVEKSELFAAVCVIAGTIGGRPTLSGTPHVNDPLVVNPPQPVSIYHVHGLLDDVVSPYGGPSPKPISTRVDRGAFNSINTWVRHNNCDRVPAVTGYAWGATSMRFENGDDNTEVLLTLLNNHGHAIPPTGIDEINNFLLAQSKP